MTSDGTEGYPSREDRIVAEFADGLDVAGIALRYGLTVAQVYDVIQREVGPAEQGLPSPPIHYPPAGYYATPDAQGPAANYYVPPPVYAAPGYLAPVQDFRPSQGFPDGDAIVAEYGEGNDVAWIARKHGINVERVYDVVQRVLGPG